MIANSHPSKAIIAVVHTEYGVAYAHYVGRKSHRQIYLHKKLKGHQYLRKGKILWIPPDAPVMHCLHQLNSRRLIPVRHFCAKYGVGVGEEYHEPQWVVVELTYAACPVDRGWSGRI